MSTNPAPDPLAASRTRVGPTVYLLHRWDPHVSETALYRDYAAALAALAAIVRANWSDVAHRIDVPDSHEGLTDAEAVLAYYGGNGGSGDTTAPTAAESFDAGFEITEEPVAGPEPREVSLRLATLRIVDDRTDAETTTVTYFMDAAGLTVAVSSGPDGYPHVLITPENRITSMPVTVRIETPSRHTGPGKTAHMS